MTTIRSAAFVAAAMLVSASAATPHAQQPSVDDLLAKGGAYVQTFVGRFSNVVAEERYKQERVSPGRKTRDLVSDYFLINIPGSGDWLECRDVISVDGKPVSDHEDRLLTLIKDGTPATWAARARAVARASARYNVEDIGTVNRPLLAMSFLQSPLQPRFDWIPGPLEKKLGPDIRLLRFRESRSPAMFAVGPVYGSIWLNEKTGVVVKTELQFGDNRRFINHVVTTFAADAELGVLVPTGMEHAYADGRVEVTGRATYGRFRKFGVTAEEEFH